MILRAVHYFGFVKPMPGMVVKNLLPNGGAFNGDESLVESVNNSPTKQTPIIRLFSAEKPSTQLFPSGPLAQNAGRENTYLFGGTNMSSWRFQPI